jgi:DNA-directed RNA polymerase beta subunit
MSFTVIKNSEEFDNSHKFLAEELLQPMTNKCDLSRSQMYASHLSQTVILNNPEKPRVFSRFENVFGKYTTAIKTLKNDAKIISIFEKNSLQKVYVIQYIESGEYDIHFSKPVRHLTENYGYHLKNDNLKNAKVDDILNADTEIQGWACNDESGNFQYGINLKTVYMNYEGKTYEDGIIASESAAERLSHTSIETVIVVLNANDLMINLYGDNQFYKGYPDVGEDIKDGILLARRRINHESILFDLSSNQLSKINWNIDTVFYSEGTVVDVDVYSNLTKDELDKYIFNQQVLEYQKHWNEFQTWLMTLFETEIQQNLYSNDVGFWYRLCKDTFEKKWRNDKSEFDGVILKFTIAKKNKLGVGSKITNRHGGKGVISLLKPDSEMPQTEDGKTAELIINSLGVINRLNPSQLYESELNFIADNIIEQIQNVDDLTAYKRILRFYQIVSTEQYDWLLENLTDQSEISEFVHEIRSKQEPIYIHQAPFFKNCSLKALDTAYTEFNVEKVKFVGIEEPLILGTNYYMKLRHEPLSKLSTRSAKNLSINGVPTKNNRGLKTNTEHHSTTPIRLG